MILLRLPWLQLKEKSRNNQNPEELRWPKFWRTSPIFKSKTSGCWSFIRFWRSRICSACFGWFHDGVHFWISGWKVLTPLVRTGRGGASGTRYRCCIFFWIPAAFELPSAFVRSVRPSPRTTSCRWTWARSTESSRTPPSWPACRSTSAPSPWPTTWWAAFPFLWASASPRLWTLVLSTQDSLPEKLRVYEKNIDEFDAFVDMLQ